MVEIKSIPRYEKHHKRMMLAEDGVKIPQYQPLMGCDYDAAMEDLRSACLEFIGSKPKAFFNRVDTLFILGVDDE